MAEKNVEQSGAKTRLMAMPPSGEYIITADEQGKLTVRGPGRIVRAVAREAVERTIAYADLDRIEQEFDSPEALEAYRQAAVSAILPEKIVDIESFDAEDINRFLKIAQKWKNEGQVELAMGLLSRLLNDAPVVAADPDLQARITNLLASISPTDSSE